MIQSEDVSLRLINQSDEDEPAEDEAGLIEEDDELDEDADLEADDEDETT